jgi:tetratricopeptide (TPR) repeat protein
MLAQLGFLFHVFRGDIEKANECRERLEAHAVQHGSAWQMEVWSSCTSNAAFGNTRDVAGNKRALAQLDRLRRQIPSLEQYWERAAATQQLLAGAPSRAAQMLEAILATAKPRERVGWGAVRGALAAAYNEHGEHARALAISEETIRVCAEDLDYVAMLLRSQMEHCRALGGLGQHEAAQARLTELFERFLPNNNPVTLGMLHCVAAELAQRRADIIEFEHHLNMMHKYFDPTRNPALIAQIDRLRNLQTGAVTSPHDQQDTSTITTGAQPFNTLLTTAYGTIERKQRALELVASQTDASQAYLFTRGWHDEPVMLSALGGVDPNPQVLEAVRSMFEAIPTDNDETAMASVASVASTTTAEPIHGHRLLPLTIVHEHKRMLIGAIAVCGGHHYRPVSHALLSELALQLYRAGDMISARTLG